MEWIATLALFRERPLGYGPGFVPGEREKQLILDAYTESGVEPSLQHLRQYVFDGRFKLHAVYADFWVNYGLIATIAFLCVLILVIGNFVVRATTCSVEAPLLWFVLVVTIWDVAFSPMYSNLNYVLLALVLLSAQSTSPERAKAAPL